MPLFLLWDTEGMLVATVAALLLLAQTPAPAHRPYNVDEAYRVYNVLLAHDKWFFDSNRTPVIQEETTTAGTPCLERVSNIDDLGSEAIRDLIQAASQGRKTVSTHS